MRYQILPGVGCDAAGECLIDWISRSGYDAASTTEIRARRYAFDGTPLGPDFALVSPGPGHSLSSPRTVMDAQGDFVLSWIDSAQTGQPTSLRWFRPDGTPRSAVVNIGIGEVSGIAMDPDGDTVVLVTTGVCPSLYVGVGCATQLQARRYTVDGKFRDTRLVTTAASGPVSGGTFNTAYTVAATQDGSFVVGWVVQQSARVFQLRVMARAYTAAGQAVGPAFVLAERPSDFSTSVPKEFTIAPGGAGRYVATWTWDRSGS